MLKIKQPRLLLERIYRLLTSQTMAVLLVGKRILVKFLGNILRRTRFGWAKLWMVASWERGTVFFFFILRRLSLDRCAEALGDGWMDEKNKGVNLRGGKKKRGSRLVYFGVISYR